MRRDWYHGSKLTRLDAERVLKENGFEEGLFLVRQSCTSLGDFVLSVVHDGQVIHYQIRKRGEDALFSLSDQQKVIHGLDELVAYYKYHFNSGLQHKLQDHVPGSECPPEVKLHGVENLLHRATSQGDDLVVKELLKCGRNLMAKNHDGQCAIHLAAFYGHVSLIQILVEHKVNVNVADSSGYTPLHVAMQAHKPDMAEALLKAGANPTIRNQITGWVPLHEAAWSGSKGCAVVLLNWYAPIMPRTPKNETPADLARANDNTHLADFLDSYPVLCPTANYEDWLHPAISRVKATQLLRGGEDGTFLIRKGTKKANTHIISLSYDKGLFSHFEVEKRGIYYFMDRGPYMHSLGHLVDHYSRFSDGLPVELRHPLRPLPTVVPHQPKPMLHSPLFDNTQPSLPPRMKKTGRQPCAKITEKRCYDNNDTLRRIRHSKDNIPMESLHLNEIIGEGEFGSVYKADYMMEDGQIRKVAVKVINSSSSSPKQDFAQEAAVMMTLDHPCIVQLIGLSNGPPVLVVLELVPLGSMLDFLLDHPDSVRTDMEIPLWAAQVACGMVYLSKKHFVHRDLAARNILLASKLQAKISDFGLSRMINMDKEYYRASRGGRWPIRWYAPECVNYGTFSHASDVWSYGVMLWEMYVGGGRQPYEGMAGEDIFKYIEAGKRLVIPESASFGVRNIISWCWEYSPGLRPSFEELLNFFTENPTEYSNLKELLLTQQDLGQLSVA